MTHVVSRFENNSKHTDVTHVQAHDIVI